MLKCLLDRNQADVRLVLTVTSLEDLAGGLLYLEALQDGIVLASVLSKIKGKSHRFSIVAVFHLWGDRSEPEPQIWTFSKFQLSQNFVSTSAIQKDSEGYSGFQLSHRGEKVFWIDTLVPMFDVWSCPYQLTADTAISAGHNMCFVIFYYLAKFRIF